MNVEYLFIISLLIFVIYRLYSSILVHRLLSNYGSSFLYEVILTILQFCDLSFIITLHINYTLQNVTPCNPQRYITNLECMFEAAPQFVVQLYFLLTLNMGENRDSDSWNANLSVVFSIFLSLLSMVNKKTSQDKVYQR